jgi:hypothetical protein
VLQRWVGKRCFGCWCLTGTYFEGEMEQNPKAKRGYSRDGWPDCLQLVIALVVTPDGFPLAYEVLNGNTADCSTLRDSVEVKLYEYWPKAAAATPRISRSGASGWCVCYASCARCAAASRNAISCCCASALRKRMPAAHSGCKNPSSRERPVSRTAFTFQTDKTKLKAAEQRDGHYLLRSNLTEKIPPCYGVLRKRLKRYFRKRECSCASCTWYVPG